ncbi:hypothetical protein IQ268_09120 [Oculatella sp. LEGE 06141]|uniref:hypothetical protein n=1 Tax=Oculatella sp. LEGE 06141 TaxID=1828648 RepID=UPI001882C0CB|nr:hypothetical protein [Oculatella sp. LEGE 06141]MBE9178720.1 hypothetical protein [Oculatella sp. LEGE 06141]
MAILTKGIKLSQLAATSPEQKASEIDSLINAALNPDKQHLEQQCNEVDARIKEFECRYEMSSDAMKQQLSQGLIKETAEICSWLLLLKVKNNLKMRPDETPTQSLSKLL